ncbi:MAG: hypothetical protein IT373_01450 [Polyangiaceae bacterium]|nr:hypothetical protein [Polyangiaceae bacterium]
MGFTRAVPSSLTEFRTSLGELAKNIGHVSSWKVNMNNFHLEVDLDWTANKIGGKDDFYIPIKRAKAREALALVENLFKLAEKSPEKVEASPDVDKLYDMIDPQAN